VQLCAQAICLEEMLGVTIPEGAIFYGAQQRRHRVVFDKGLREKTEHVAQALHELMARRDTPRAVWEPKCKNCSLVNLCLPEALASSRSAEKYLLKALTQTEEKAGKDS
jgi:CRISPR-associated exonuclease Cas4